MFSWVSRHKWTSLGICISICVLVIILLNLNQRKELYWDFMVVFLFVVISNFLIEILANIEYRKAHNYLNHECDPYKYAEIVDAMYENNIFKNYHMPFLINKGLGLSSRGMHAEHLALLNSVNIEKIALPIEMKILYLNNLMSAYIENEDLEKASECFNSAKQIIDKNFINPNRKEIHEKSLDINMAYIFMLQNKLDEAEKILINNHFLFNTRFNKVVYNDILADLYIIQGRVEEARVCLEYVIINGNKLHLVEKAKIKIDTL